MNKNPSKYQGNELKYLKQVLNSENWSCTAGSWVQNFEKKFAELIGTKYAVAMNSGTATLHAALEAVGVKAGDEVITPALTVIMDTTCILHCGAIPVYADINPNTFCINPEDVAKKITSKTKAIIAVSLYGLPPDYDKLKKIAGNIPIIEDNAQSMLNKYKNQNVGTIGTISSYSFENSKHICTGEGGMVCTDNEILAEKMRKIGGHGFKNLRAEEGRVRLNPEIFQSPNYKRHDIIGWNYRMSEFSAAIGLAQLEQAVNLVWMRIQSAATLIEPMKNSKIFVLQNPDYDCSNSYYTLGVIYNGYQEYGVTWEKFREEFVKRGGDGFFGAWSVPYLEPVMETREFVKRNPDIYEKCNYHRGLCPLAEIIQPKIMQFKTNYRSEDLVKRQALILEQLIKDVEKGTL